MKETFLIHTGNLLNLISCWETWHFLCHKKLLQTMTGSFAIQLKKSIKHSKWSYDTLNVINTSIQHIIGIAKRNTEEKYWKGSGKTHSWGKQYFLPLNEKDYLNDRTNWTFLWLRPDLLSWLLCLLRHWDNNCIYCCKGSCWVCIASSDAWRVEQRTRLLV